MAILLHAKRGTYTEIHPSGSHWTREEIEFFIGGHAESVGSLPGERDASRYIVYADRDRAEKKLPDNILATGYTGKPVSGNVVVVKESDVE